MKKKCLAFIFAVVCINYGYSNDTLLRSVNSQFIEIINKETFYKYFYPKKSYKKGIKHVTDDGFFINTGASFYSKDFFVQKGFSNNTKERFSVGLNFEIGNMYRAFWYDTIVIGVKVSWLSLNYSTFKIENKLQYQVIQANLFKVGPYFTRGLSDEMAIDIFAQIAPVYMYNLKDATENHGYAGFTYSLGFELRYEGATIGTDYNIGRASLIDKHAGLFFTKPQISYFRIFLGYKF